jgi:hypothetical protein
VITYFDTSAFVKTVVAEEGSDAAVEIWNSSAIRVTSIVAYAEARAALAAAARSGRLPVGVRQRARSRPQIDHPDLVFRLGGLGDEVQQARELSSNRFPDSIRFRTTSSRRPYRVVSRLSSMNALRAPYPRSEGGKRARGGRRRPQSGNNGPSVMCHVPDT